MLYHLNKVSMAKELKEVYHRNSSPRSKVIESDIRTSREDNPSAGNLNRDYIPIFMNSRSVLQFISKDRN
jgi:hypothetical protein